MTTDPVLRVKTRRSLFFQMSLVVLPFALFSDVAFFFRGPINLAPVVAILMAFLLNGAFLAFVVLTVIYHRQLLKSASSANRFRADSCLSKIKAFLPLLIVIATFSVLAILQFDNIPRYDGSQYYSSLITATETFQFDFVSLLTSFVLMWHPTQGFSLFLAIGEMLFPKQSIGVYGVTLLLVILAMLCLYDILGRIAPKASPGARASGVAIFAFCPYILGLFSHTTPDYYLPVFFILMVWAFAREYTVLSSFLAIIVCFCKEPGIILVSAFLVTALIIRITQSQGKSFWHKAMHYLWPTRLIFYGCAPLLFVLYYKTIGKLDFMSVVTNVSPMRWDSDGMHCFGLNFMYIIARLMQILVFNFYWIGFILGSVLIIFLYVRLRASTAMSAASLDGGGQSRTDDVKSTDLAILSGIIMSSFAYLIFTCLFITFLCARYATFFSVLLSCVCVIAISTMIRRKYLGAIILSCIALLNIGQNYTNLDPTITMTCPQLDVGHQSLYSPMTKYYRSVFRFDYVTEFYVYNRMFSYADELLDRVMKRIDLKEEDKILYIDSDWFELHVFGLPSLDDNLIYWDPVAKRRTYDNSTEGTFVPKYINCSSEELSGDEKLILPDHFYLMTTAHTPSESIDNLLKHGYAATDTFVEENSIGYITVYNMEKLDILE